MTNPTTAKIIALLRAAEIQIGKGTGRKKDRRYGALIVTKHGRAVSVSAPSAEDALAAANALRGAGLSIWSPVTKGIVTEPTLENMRNGIFLVGR